MGSGVVAIVEEEEVMVALVLVPSLESLFDDGDGDDENEDEDDN